MRAIDRRHALASVAIAAALSVGYVGAAYATVGGTNRAAGATDTEPPPETTPAPDPAPPAPKPAPKTTPHVSKPAPKPVSHTAPVYHAPAPVTTPRVTYTPPPVVHHSTPKVVTHRKHKHKHKRTVVHAKPVPQTQAHVKSAAVIEIPPVPVASAAPSSGDGGRSALVIAGLGLAALLFLVVSVIPTTPARFTQAGRAVIDHQTELVLTGVGTLLLTAMLFLLTSGG
ncbi:MAG: hypothetical protein ACJ74M_00640 [Gaiellaceae bacterium]